MAVYYMGEYICRENVFFDNYLDCTLKVVPCQYVFQIKYTNSRCFMIFEKIICENHENSCAFIRFCYNENVFLHNIMFFKIMCRKVGFAVLLIIAVIFLLQI